MKTTRSTLRPVLYSYWRPSICLRIAVAILPGIFCVKPALAQQLMQFSNASYSGGIPNGPSTNSLTVNLLQYSAPSTFASLSSPVTVTATFSNQQYTGQPGNQTSGLAFGSTVGSVANSPAFIAAPVFAPMDAIAAPANSTFTANPYTGAGTGISVTQNYAFSVMASCNMWIGTGGPAGKRAYYGDITFTFSRPVSDPVLQVVGMGAEMTGGNRMTAELQLPAGSGLSLTNLSSDNELTVPATNDRILNGATSPDASCGGGSACGSVKINGTNITSVTFNIYVRFKNTTFPGDFSNGSEGDLFLLGFSGASFNLSGAVFDDANGMNDNTVNGVVTNAAGTLYAFAIDSFGKIQGSTPVSAAGAYNFPNLFRANYTVELSTSPGALENAAPGASLPANWVSTGENIGTGAGSLGIANESVVASLGTSDLLHVDFGIDQKPIANAVTYSLSSQPVQNSIMTLNGPVMSAGTGSTPGLPNGSDPEDGSLGSGDRLLINTLPTAGSLFYNGVAVTAGQNIPSFDPNLLTIQYTGTGYDILSFTYSYADAASVYSTPATYTIMLPVILPVGVLHFSVLPGAGNTADLSWQASAEQKGLGFNVQESSDGIRWNNIGFVPTKSTAGAVDSYFFSQSEPGSGTYFYRLQCINADGTSSYSYIASIEIGTPGMVQVYPNPISDRLTITGAYSYAESVKLYDTFGRILTCWGAMPFPINIYLPSLPPGIYFIKLNFPGGKAAFQKLLKIQH